MVYGWSKNDLLEDKNELLSLLHNESNIDKKIEYMDAIDIINSNNIDDIICKYNIKTLKSNLLFNIAENMSINNRYYELCNYFYNNSLKYIDSRNKLFKLALKCSGESLNYTMDNNYVIELIHSHYESLDKELFEVFKTIYDKQHIFVKYSDNIDSFIGNISDGYCLYIPVLNKNYIEISNSEGVSKIINTAHEIGHAISNLYSPYSFNNRKDDYLTEVASLFFELIINYDVTKNISSFDSALINMETFDNYYEYSLLLSFHNKIVNSWIDNNGVIDNSFYKELKSKYKISKSDFKESINSTIKLDGPYIISYMVALCLFNIYKHDKKSSIEILKLIIKNGYKDSYGIINEYIKDLSLFSKEINLIEKNMSSEINKVLIK